MAEKPEITMEMQDPDTETIQTLEPKTTQPEAIQPETTQPENTETIQAQSQHEQEQIQDDDTDIQSDDTHIDDQDEQQISTLARQRRKTAKGIQYQIEVKEKSLRSIIQSWRKKADRVEAVMVDTDNMTIIKEYRDRLSTLMANTEDEYGELIELNPETRIQIHDVRHATCDIVTFNAASMIDSEK